MITNVADKSVKWLNKAGMELENSSYWSRLERSDPISTIYIIFTLSLHINQPFFPHLFQAFSNDSSYSLAFCLPK